MEDIITNYATDYSTRLSQTDYGMDLSGADTSQTQTPLHGREPPASYASAVSASTSSTDPNFESSTLSSDSYFIRKYSIRSTSGSDLRCLNVFKASHELEQTIGSFSKFDHSADHSITITIKSSEQACKLLIMQKLMNEQVTVEVHPSCRQSQGIITSSILQHMTEKDILEGLSSQHVSKVTRLPQSKATFRLSFDQTSPPKVLILCTGHTAKVRMVYPLPTRCFKCQYYGHSHTTCRNRRVICGRCGKEASQTHDPKNCTEPENCFHCNLPHAATSRLCPKYQEEKKILLLHHRDKITLPNARRLVALERPHKNESNPSATRPATTNRRASADTIMHMISPANGGHINGELNSKDIPAPAGGTDMPLYD